MKKFQFLLLDAGPIIKLFELDIWDAFIEKCDVTIARTVAEQAVFAIKNDHKEYIDFALESWVQKGLIKIIDMEISVVKDSYDKFDLEYKAIIHPGERETLAFFCTCSEDWKLCTTDGAVFRILGLLGKSQQGISLEEIFKQIGRLPQQLEWKFTKKFREKFSRMGQADYIQDKGLL